MLAERLTAQLLAGPPARDPVARLRAAARGPGAGPARRAPGDPGAHPGAHGGRRRPRAHAGALAADHLAQPRHAASRAQRGLPVAAGAHDAAAADRQRAAAAPGGRRRGRRGARRRDRRARAGRARAADARAAARPPRRGGGADGGAGARPPADARLPARDRGARPDGRRPPRLRAGARLAGGAALPSTAIARWRSWRAATSPVTVPRATATSRSGPGCRCATPVPDSPRSPPSCASATTACSTSPGAQPLPSCPRHACSVPTTRCCSAGPRASRSWATIRGSSPSTASSGRSRSCAAVRSRRGGSKRGGLAGAVRPPCGSGHRGARHRRGRCRAVPRRVSCDPRASREGRRATSLRARARYLTVSVSSGLRLKLPENEPLAGHASPPEMSLSDAIARASTLSVL